jgi:putative ABC transport system permease protein
MEYESLGRMSSSLPFVFLGVAALVLVMMLGRMVKQERIKIGILKALGYHNRDIMIHYTKYAALTGFLGGFAGGLLGMASAGGMTQLFLTFFHIPYMSAGFFPSVLVQALVSSCVFCVIAGLFGSRGVLKISPADSMKNEAPKAGKRTIIESIPALWRRFSFSQKLVVKNVFRNKKRTAFVLMGVSLTYAMMLFTTSMPQMVDKLMYEHYEDFQKMEYTITLRAPVKAHAINDLAYIIDVDYMEGKLEYAFEFENGNKTQIASIIGLQSDTKFYALVDLAGRPLALPKTGVLITENLARNIGVKTGDIVKLNTFIPGRNNTYVEIKGLVAQALGMNAYMDIGYMGKTLLEKNAVNGIYLNSGDETLYDKLLPIANIASVMSVEETRAIMDEYMLMTNASMVFMVFFSGILGFCIVYNATTIIISEREMEFSALRVLGLGKNEIFKMIVNENNMVMIAGILAGIPLGISLLSTFSAAYNTDMFTINMEASPSAALIAAALTALFVIFAQVATYRKLSRLDLLSALKNRMN